MPILKKKCKEFPNKTPILFEQQEFVELNSHLIKESDNYRWSAKLEDKLRIDRKIVNWSTGGYGSNRFITNYGVIYRDKIIAIVLRDNTSNKLEIYCDSYYFDLNKSHKKYINKFARENSMSVRKDIFYIDKDLLDSWTRPFEVGLEFYEDEAQDKATEGLFAKLRAEYPELILPEPIANTAVDQDGHAVAYGFANVMA